MAEGDCSAVSSPVNGKRCIGCPEALSILGQGDVRLFSGVLSQSGLAPSHSVVSASVAGGSDLAVLGCLPPSLPSQGDTRGNSYDCVKRPFSGCFYFPIAQELKWAILDLDQ